MTPRTLGAQVAQLLSDRGVTTVFGVPGVHNIELYRGIEATGLAHVLARHEQGAGFMADGYARASGGVGVAFVISGPGLTNIMTPMGQAWSDDVPIIVISSCLDPDPKGRRLRLHQMPDQQGAAATVCDWSNEAQSATDALALVAHAFDEIAAGRRRPKHIQIPIGILGGPAARTPLPAEVPAPATPDATEIAALARAIAKARRPLFVLGGGASRADTKGLGALRRVVHGSGAAIFMTYAGRGLVAPDMPLCMGSLLARPEAATLVGEADLVIAVGTRLGEGDLWRDHLGHNATLVRVDHDPAVLKNGAGAPQVTWPILADAAHFFGQLDRALPADLRPKDWERESLAKLRRRWRAGLADARPGIQPVIDALRASLPDETRIFSDMTQFAYLAKETWDLKAPNLWHHPTGFGALGYALPAAIGGLLARPDQPTIAIAGDYGFQYTLPELGVAAEYGLPLPILLWDNNGLGEIEETMRQAQIRPVGVTAANPDFLALGRAYGIDAIEPASLAALQASASAALKAPRPTLIRMTPALGAV